MQKSNGGTILLKCVFLASTKNVGAAYFLDIKILLMIFPYSFFKTICLVFSELYFKFLILYYIKRTIFGSSYDWINNIELFFPMGLYIINEGHYSKALVILWVVHFPTSMNF